MTEPGRLRVTGVHIYEHLISLVKQASSRWAPRWLVWWVWDLNNPDHDPKRFEGGWLWHTSLAGRPLSVAWRDDD
jgi:hypothetical protein